jgi:hypothetical protein
LQAQLLSAAYLGLLARTAQLAQSQIDAALNTERSIVRSWLMRGTLHLVSSEDLRWMLQVLGPVLARGNRARHRQLGLQDDLKLRGVAAIRKMLASTGPLTRFEIVDGLRRHRIVLDAKTQAPIHLIQLAALQGVCCRGPDRENGEPTYVLIEDWLGRSGPMPPSSPAGELAHRYLSAFGPATVRDFAAWSGLPMPEARSALAAIRPSLEQLAIGTEPGFVVAGTLPKGPKQEGNVRLLPAFDSYLLGYRSRDLAVSTQLQRRLQRGGGWLHPAVVIDGRAIAGWSLRKLGAKAELLVEVPRKLEESVHRKIEAETHEIERFLEIPITLIVVGL